MSTTRYRADEYAEIAKHLKGIEDETLQRINSVLVEEAKETPAIDDVYGMYGYPCGYVVIAGYDMQVSVDYDPSA